MSSFKSEPCPVTLAKQRARASVAIASVAFVAVGAIGWIGLETIRASDDPKRIYSSAPPAGMAHQIMMAIKAPRERENEQARLALLNDDDGPMVVKRLESVVELTQIDRDKTIKAEPEPDLSDSIETPLLAAISQPQPPDPVVAEATTVSLEAAPEPSCIDELVAMVENSVIRFEIGSAELEGTEQPSLLALGHMTVACPEAKIQVTGHSDSSGSDLINLALSWQRADNTVAALAALGIDTAQFEPIGFGARSPAAQGDSSDEDLNRRVEFVVLQSLGG